MVAKSVVQQAGKEVFFDESDFIVSKTDLRGVITYANKAFVDLSQYALSELVGRPHSIIRHEKMPRCVFQLLWDTIQRKNEIFAYVVNRCKNGDYYWVLAHVTVDLDPKTGEPRGYHSSRRVPTRSAVEQISEIYRMLRAEEEKYSSKREGIQKSSDLLNRLLDDVDMTYEQFVFSLHTGDI